MSDSNTTIYLNKVLGQEVPVKVPSTVEAATEAFGAAVVLDLFIRQVMYQSYNSRFRSEMCKALVEKGVKWPQKTVNGVPLFTGEGDEKEPVLVTEKAFYESAKASVPKEWLTKTGLEIAAKLTFADCIVEKRGSKPAKEHTAIAKLIWDGVVAGNNTPERVAERSVELTGQPLANFGDVDWDDEEIMLITLAKMVKAGESKETVANKYA